VKVATEGFNEEAGALRAAVAQLKAEGLLPIAYVSTAGTTDFGSVGNLGALADEAHAHGMWFHVDAAYGGALRFSKRHASLLDGIDKADSITLDFHKLFYQPISCSVVLVRDKRMFDYIRLHADYLNPESNEDLGLVDLVWKSIQTTRRFDALKPIIALQHVGTDTFGAMIDHTIALTQAVADRLEADPAFALATRPTLNAVVFRYVPTADLSETQADSLNSRLKTQLLLSGQAVIGQTAIKGRAYLKFTLLNPMTQLHEVEALLDDIRYLGRQLEAEFVDLVASHASASA
jgi:L-2,4-diaminobutyrate decarboxylase